MSALDGKPNRKIDKWEYAIKKAGEFSRKTACKLCQLNKPCRKRVDDDHVWAGGCEAFLLAAVIAGILDLDGNPVEDSDFRELFAMTPKRRKTCNFYVPYNPNKKER